MKVLAIGNSFSVDAFAWLHEIAAAQGVSLLLGNLYIGGCSLERHDLNIRENRADYVYYKTGCEPAPSGVQAALRDEDWDVVTVQQCSHDSGRCETYQPFLTRICAYVRLLRPRARLMVHETWAYELDSPHAAFPRYDCSQAIMYAALRDAYRRAASSISAPLIPCGDAMQIARLLPPFDYAHGGLSLCRDGFHASLLYGRYLLGCVWLEALTGQSCVGNTFVPRLPEQSEPSTDLLAALQMAAHQAVLEREI